MSQINKPSDYFNTILWTADGTSPRSFTGVGFQPDLVWGKRRSVAADHNLYDVVRGAGSDKALMSNATSEEGNASASFGYLSSLDSDGFTTTTGSTNNNYWNNGTDTYVAWNWLAGGTASSNTDGSITSSVSANTTSGFSIVKYTGNATNSTVGHGLGVTPQVVIVKNLDSTGASAEHWRVQHHKVAASKVLYLNLTNAEDTNGDFQSTYPTSSYFSISSADGCNKNGENHIAYCFAEKKGFSKAFSYTGNGSADGSFCYLGFRPAFVMIKSSSLGQDWFIHDNKRSNFNVSNTVLLPNTADADITDTTVYGIDMVSNGFKVRGTHARINQSSATYIGIAFAENPLVGTNNIPACAR